jgi:hypothetical protein
VKGAVWQQAIEERGKDTHGMSASSLRYDTIIQIWALIEFESKKRGVMESETG